MIAGLESQLWDKINNKTKPMGALGRLEEIAVQIGLIQNSLDPVLHAPHILVFAGDHGIAKEGVSAYPQEVTHQMVLNFLAGGAAINVLAQQHGIQLSVIDAGVNYDFKDQPGLINQKVDPGTSNFLFGDAMTYVQLEQALRLGSEAAETLPHAKCNVMGFGEMGIANTSAASMIMSQMCAIPIADCVGRGTGLNDPQVQHKIAVLDQATRLHGTVTEPQEVLRRFGGFEMAQMCGAMLRSAELGRVVLVDGFIATASYLVAQAIQPEIARYAVFTHQSQEQGHRKLLEFLGAKPLLQLDMRLGEGTGCAVAYPVLQSAVAILNQMASFESAGVSQKSEA
ncbi:MAG TPA: nicotinate-nucleotide--dimethylbenzimidazole phosphoribosyltransferase [Cytophagales bacterium]|nr:nicotinate-nucleotide--dimethylbenzimidazole phosphoribosyltransferase [Cytophagales bacterium]HAA21544.1 nicotinate-nucleotide--dimethylbenzimidazole phosphoribosyltransferase [Cytophagales bacterium]